MSDVGLPSGLTATIGSAEDAVDGEDATNTENLAVTWEGDYDADGNQISSPTGITFTNNHNASSVTPKTGDTGITPLQIALIVTLICAGVALIIFFARRRRNQQ